MMGSGKSGALTGTSVSDGDSADSKAVGAADDPEAAGELIREYLPFLKRRAAQYAGGSDGRHYDELLDTAMLAFYEAIRSYDPDKGRFFSLADRVVRVRLLDFMRALYRGEGRTVSIEAPGDEDGNPEEMLIKPARLAFDAEQRRDALREEIARFSLELADWGITMQKLAAASPKHKKLRALCKQAVARIAKDVDIMQTLWLKHYFPVKKVSQLSNIPVKKLERLRIFIIASLIITAGDYDYLAGYIRSDEG